jgi:battenin
MSVEPHSTAALHTEGVFVIPSIGKKRLSLKLGVSFFLFGLINNVLYVIILSAALDLVPPSTPKGIIAFCNIAPALIAKLGWPYFLKGRIRYARRIVGCCTLSFIGMLVVAFHESLYSRLLGICLASFSSGLGEMTFLQLSTTYSRSVGGRSVGYFASGTGAAGIVGAFIGGNSGAWVLVPVLASQRFSHSSFLWHTFSYSPVQQHSCISHLLRHTPSSLLTTLRLKLMMIYLFRMT